MKKYLNLLVCFFTVSALIVSCSKSSPGPQNSNGNNNGNNGGSGGGGSDNSTPYFEYTIGSDNPIRVNCHDIKFSAEAGDVITGVFATSASTKATFSFAFPAFSGAVEAAGIGAYPVKEYAGFAEAGEAFEFSLKVPKTSGGTDYYISIAPTSASHKNEVKKIEKGSIESGKQVFWIEGEYRMPAKNASNQNATISGKYRFKLLTLTTASAVLPVVKTTAISDTTGTSAKCTAEVTFDGNASVTERGVCWSVLPEPTIADSKAISGNGKGAFIADIIDLRVNTKYYVRAYATNSKGTAYGNQLEFNTRASLPKVTTGDIEHNYPTYAEASFTVDDNGGSFVLYHGLCWSTSQNPTINDAKTVAGDWLPTHEKSMRPLKPNTTYYYRAYATNKAGTAYGKQLSFKTGQFSYGTMTDVDGNVYKTIRIGERTWMAENLRTTHYRNGDAIPLVADTSWFARKQGAYCYYNNDKNNNDAYGKLYNWYAATDPRGIAPTGWRIPTVDDINNLYFYLNGSPDARENGTLYWEDDAYHTNKYGFNARGSGVRVLNFGFWRLRKGDAYWWDESYSLDVGHGFSFSGLSDLYNKTSGLSIRLVRD